MKAGTESESHASKDLEDNEGSVAPLRATMCACATCIVTRKGNPGDAVSLYTSLFLRGLSTQLTVRSAVSLVPHESYCEKGGGDRIHSVSSVSSKHKNVWPPPPHHPTPTHTVTHPVTLRGSILHDIPLGVPTWSVARSDVPPKQVACSNVGCRDEFALLIRHS